MNEGRSFRQQTFDATVEFHFQTLSMNKCLGWMVQEYSSGGQRLLSLCVLTNAPDTLFQQWRWLLQNKFISWKQLRPVIEECVKMRQKTARSAQIEFELCRFYEWRKQCEEHISAEEGSSLTQ